MKQTVNSKDKKNHLLCVRFENARKVRVGPFPASNVAWNEINITKMSEKLYYFKCINNKDGFGTPAGKINKGS